MNQASEHSKGMLYSEAAGPDFAHHRSRAQLVSPYARDVGMPGWHEAVLMVLVKRVGFL